ncbi:MAG: hypothetical protein HY815_24685 [Candidatus Riflebacteria bacterium]|nr:hypothetical protein [Candidatus Riflebacteria bacterium]
MEFYQSHMQRSEWGIDYKFRRDEFAYHIRSHHREINDIYRDAFRWRPWGESIDGFVDLKADEIFGYTDLEMKSIIKAYLKQKPRRALLFFDIESVDKYNSEHIFEDPVGYFTWMEPALRTIQGFLEGHGVRTAVNATGKGYHILASVPLYSDGRQTDAMMMLMQAGGYLQPETLDRLVTLIPGEKHHQPTPALTQLAYQGCCRISQYVVANTIDQIRHELRRRGMTDHVGFTDNEPHQISLDLTSGLRQVNMSCFGSPGSVYNKNCPYWIIRIPRSRDGEEFFGGNIAQMIRTRSDPDAALAHLVSRGCRIPASTRGIEELIGGYNNSRMKKELWDPLDAPFDPVFLSELINTNFMQYRRRAPGINGLLDFPSGRMHPFLDPDKLEYVYHHMARRGMSMWEMVHLTLAVYHDKIKDLDIHRFYSRAELARWPAILFTEHFKGW